MIDLPLNLELIERRADAATPGPWVPVDWPVRHPNDPEWEVESHQHELDGPVGVVGHGVEQGRADAEFIAMSRQVVPDLVARVRELEAALARVGSVIWDLQGLDAIYEDVPTIVSRLRAAVSGVTSA